MESHARGPAMVVDYDRAGTVPISAPGWMPIEVEYGFTRGTDVTLIFQVKGTGIQFCAPAETVYAERGADFESLFKDTLGNLREAYIGWLMKDFPEEWMLDYRQDFGRLILL